MTVIRALVQVSLLIACAATSFVSAQVYMSGKEEAQQNTRGAKPDLIALRLSSNGDSTKAMSPIIPTIKYANSASAPVPVKKPLKTAAAVKASLKVAGYPASKMPMQLASYNSAVTAYVSEPQVAVRAGVIFAHMR
jgi:hypothetical protein